MTAADTFSFWLAPRRAALFCESLLRLNNFTSSGAARALFAIGLIVGLAHAPSAEAADIYFGVEDIEEEGHPYDGSTVGYISLTGEIQDGDADDLQRILEGGKENGILFEAIRLYSPGGSASEGLVIGRLIRAARLIAIAPIPIGSEDFICINLENGDPDCVCASACAMAWLGGLQREGVVGVHRSFLGNRADFNDTEEALDLSHAEIRAYIEEMRLPSWVADRILSTPSDEIVSLHYKDDPGIQFDPIYEEYLRSRCTRPYSEEEQSAFADLMKKEWEWQNGGRPLSVVEQAALDHFRLLLDASDSCRRSAHLDAVATISSP